MADFTKYHALGNDYVLIDPLHNDVPLDGHAARALCDRHTGLGADGVLFGPLEPPGPGAPVRLSVFNADGSACARTANGIRMAALYLAEHYGLTGQISVHTAGGESLVQIEGPLTSLDARPVDVRIGLGRPSFDPRDLPVLGVDAPLERWILDVDGTDVEVTSFTDGNPHTVVFTEESERLVHELGPRIAGHPRFRHRTNVEFARVLDRRTLQVEIWERGAGYTRASGSGACAAAAAAHLRGLAEPRVAVRMPGGTLQVETDGAGCLWLTGPVEQVARGSLAPALRARLVPHAPRAAAAPAASTQCPDSGILVPGGAA